MRKVHATCQDRGRNYKAMHEALRQWVAMPESEKDTKRLRKQADSAEFKQHG